MVAVIVHDYPLDRYDFPGRVRRILDVPDLGALHPGAGSSAGEVTPVHRRFYDAFDEIAPVYHDFVVERIAPLFGEPVYVQRVPTFRISVPNGTAVSRFHRDSEFHHQPATVNFWLPLTPAFATNTVWVESAPDRGDFGPAELDPGQVLQFDAIKLRHGNQRNETGRTRVSFDFRVIPCRLYRSTGRYTVTSNMRMEIGEYYMTLDQLPQRSATISERR